MRIRLTFDVLNRGALIPFHHQNLIFSVFNVLMGGKLHEYPYCTFSAIKGQTRLGRNGLHYNSKKVTIVVSSLNLEFIDDLVATLLPQREITIGNLSLKPEKAELEQDVALSDQSKYVCLSPLVLELSKTAESFLEPDANEFSDLLFDATISRMQDFGYQIDDIPDFHKFQLVPDQEYIERLRDSKKKFSRVYPFDRSGDIKEVRGYTFPFTLYAAREIQEFVYSCGLGVASNRGFGLLDIAHENPVDRVVIYKTREQLVGAE